MIKMPNTQVSVRILIHGLVSEVSKEDMGGKIGVKPRYTGAMDPIVNAVSVKDIKTWRFKTSNKP